MARQLQTELDITKQVLRAEVRQRLTSMTQAQRNGASAAACALLETHSLWKNAQSVLFFAPLPQELDVWPLLPTAIKGGKAVALPSFSATSNEYFACEVRDVSTDLKTGKFGIREPADHCQKLSLKRLDLILVPGVAFDLSGRRLGRGKGFYDRLLATVSGTRCGVAFDEQIVGEVPAAPHDQCVNCILTPTRWVEL
jgi:5-formyltetrahydrofolate cyclo-ligase